MKEIFEEIVKNTNLKDTQLSSLVWFTDDNVGFSIKKEYPQKLINRLKIVEDKKYLAFIQLRVNKKGDGGKYPIDVRCDFLHYDKESEIYVYNYKYIKRKFFIPFEEFSSNEFYLDVQDKSLLRKKNKQFLKTDLLEIIEIVFGRHLKTHFYIKPIATLFRKKIARTLICFLKIVQNLLGNILRVLFGIRFKYDYFDKYFMEDKYEMRDIAGKAVKADASSVYIEIKGVKLPAYAVFIFCAFHLMVFHFFYHFQIIKTLKESSTTDTLFVMYAFVAWCTYQVIIPKLIQSIYKILSAATFKLRFYA